MQKKKRLREEAIFKAYCEVFVTSGKKEEKKPTEKVIFITPISPVTISVEEAEDINHGLPSYPSKTEEKTV